MIADKKTISEQCDLCVNLHLGAKFSWRKYQKETVTDIIYNIIDDNNIYNVEYNKLNQIVQAPTGSGKSIMMMVVAGVLSEYYNKECYILCSDISLYKQYEDFVNTNRLNGIIGCIKGMTGNYVCNVVDGEPNRQTDIINAPCRQRRIGWNRLFDTAQAKSLGFPCVSSCKYIKERKNCINKKIIVTTYQNYITQTSGLKDTAFNSHTVLLMDECHNIPSVIQMMFSCIVSENQLKTLDSVYNFILGNKDKWWSGDQGAVCSFSETQLLKESNGNIEYYKKSALKYIKELYVSDIYNKAGKEHVFSVLNKYFDTVISPFIGGVSLIESYISYIYKQDDTAAIINGNLKQVYSICQQFRKFIYEPLEKFVSIINDTAEEYIVKKNIEYNSKKQQHVQGDDNNTIGVQFQCVKESLMCDEYLFNTAEYCVLMSATVGNKGVYIKNISDSIDKFIYTEVPSTFNFDQSPVYVFSNYKLSYTNKNTLLPDMLKTTENIISQFSGMRGVIQTANYEIMNYIYNNINNIYKKRLFIYNDSKEKLETMERFKKCEDSILIGPSVYEGIDLPDDMCRFIIIMKVPYPSLGDIFTKAKMELYRGWYESHTSDMIIQGIGRGIRNKSDWCQTFILDANFIRLYNSTKSQYPAELQERIQIL